MDCKGPKFYTPDGERAAWGRSLGLQSAIARRAANADRDFRIIEGRDAGWSQRHLAKLFKMIQKQRVESATPSHEIGE